MWGLIFEFNANDFGEWQRFFCGETCAHPSTFQLCNNVNRRFHARRNIATNSIHPLPRCWNRKVTFNAIRPRGENVAQQTLIFPGEARFGDVFRATRIVLHDIESAARANAGSSRQRQDKRQVIPVFITQCSIFPLLEHRAVAYSAYLINIHHAREQSRAGVRFTWVSRDGAR